MTILICINHNNGDNGNKFDDNNNHNDITTVHNRSRAALLDRLSRASSREAIGSRSPDTRKLMVLEDVVFDNNSSVTPC